MKITETITARRSVRTYNGEALDDATAGKPHKSISTLLNGGKPTQRKPFGETCREEGMAGRLEILTDIPSAPKATYVASWVGMPTANLAT